MNHRPLLNYDAYYTWQVLGVANLLSIHSYLEVLCFTAPNPAFAGRACAFKLWLLACLISLDFNWYLVAICVLRYPFEDLFSWTERIGSLRGSNDWAQ